MCRILILLCVCTEHSVSRRTHLCLSWRISKRAYVLSSNHWNSACFHASPMFTQCGRISTLTRYPCHTSTTTSICLIFSSPFLSLSHFLQTIAIHTPDQSQKNPVSASAMLNGKFLRIRKVFATSSLFAEEFPDILENVRILYKISR